MTDSQTGFDLLDRGLPWLAENVEKALERFDPATGRFLVNGGWANTNQDIMLSMAYLFLSPHPGNRYFRDASFLETIGKAGDAIRDFQYPDGKVEFVKVDGSRWGPIYMPWTMYHWVETFYLLRGVLAAERIDRWESGLRLAFEGIDREMRQRLERSSEDHQGATSRESVVHNIPTWNAMGLHRASSVLGRPEWKTTANQMIQLAVGAQHPEGYWEEFQGPTTSYNRVYVHALGLYHLHGGEVDVLPSLARAARFHEIFTYPDGTLVETIDGRVKHHDHLSASGLVGLSLIPPGRRYAKEIVRRAIGRGERWTEPHFAQLLMHWADEPTVEAPSLFEQPSFQVTTARALVVKEHRWYVCLSGYTTPDVESRWGQDRQSFVGIWNEASGLIVGGGNSKDQPEWSTFEVTTADGQRIHVPDRGATSAAERSVALTYRDRQFQVQIVSLGPGELTLRFTGAAPPGDSVFVHVPIQLRPGETLATSAGEPRIVSDSALAAAAGPGSHWIRHRDWQLTFDTAFTLDWPSYPFNPYAQDGKSDLDAAIAVLTLPLNRIVELRLQTSA